MWPTLIKIGPVPLHTYGLMIAIGFLAAVYFIRRDASKAGINPEILTDAAFWVLLLGLTGTRLLYIAMYPDQFSWRNPMEWFAIWKGGLVFHGALPPAIACVLYMIHKHKLKTWVVADVVSPYIPLGHALGRLGCFLNGCCYGTRTDLPWAIPFPRIPADPSQTPVGSPAFLDHYYGEGLPRDALWSYPVHPTQLYSVLALLTISFLLLLAKNRWKPFTGFTFPLYLMSYGAYRFFVEFVRGDHNPRHLGGRFTDQQLMCVIMVVAGIVLWVVLSRREKRLSPKSAHSISPLT